MNQVDFLTSFWQRLRTASQRVLLLDYDGTLAPFRKTRDQAVPYPGVQELLAGILADGGTRLIIVTGRPAADLLPLLGLDRQPEVWGCHGWERLLPGGKYELGSLPAGAGKALGEARRWALDQGYGAQCESKPVSIALHWRGLPPEQAARMRSQARSAWAPMAAGGGLELHPFDGGLELRCPGRDKGSAVRQVLAETDPGAAIAYLGDDLTDEDAFTTLKGRGLTILVREQYRPTAADHWLTPPAELLAFLREWRHWTEGR
jgi:trehalose-phosphatase